MGAAIPLPNQGILYILIRPAGGRIRVTSLYSIVSRGFMESAGAAHAIGSIVQVRGRDWVVTASDGEILRLKLLSGGEEEGSAIHLGVEGALVSLSILRIHERLDIIRR